MADGKPPGYLAKYGEKLIDAGYLIIPIRRGSKAPPFKDWEKTRATKKQLRDWLTGLYPKSGVGILTRNTPAVDLDILDEKMALQMERFVQERFGIAPVRVGQAPKRLLLFRTDKPFPKINSNVYEDEWGDPKAAQSQSGADTGHLRKIEILGDGQQFVAYARHPDTGQPYQWLAGDSPLITPAADLPLLTQEDGQAIVAEFERLAVEAGWEVKKSARALARPAGPAKQGQIDHDDVFAADSPKTDIAEEELHAKLLLVPGNEDYETWLQIGMALFHQFDGESRGLELWHEWSEGASNYDADALDAKWDTFDITTKGRAPVTARLIIKLAVEAQKEIATETFAEVRAELASASTMDALREVCEKVKHIEFDMFARNQIVGAVKDAFKRITGHPLTVGAARDMVRYENPGVRETPRWLEGWVYVSIDESFYNIDRRSWLSTPAFNAVHARYLLTKKDVLEGRSTPEQVASHIALNLCQIPVVHNRMYVPGEDDLFTMNSTPYVNSYDDRNIPDTPAKFTAEDRAAIATVEAHGHHLFDVTEDLTILLDALAYLVQNPGKRMNWAILLQGVEGDGKSFYSNLMAAVLGAENVRILQAQALEDKFNSWAEGAQLVFFEEIKLHGHNRFDVLNKIKPNITNTTVSIRRMQTDWYEAINMSSYILTTNFKDALPLDENDSRYFVMFSRWQTRADVVDFEKADPHYFDRLFGSLERAGALRKWLQDRKISKAFNPLKRAPSSAAKREMIGYSRSEEAQALLDIIKESERPDVSAVLLNATDLIELMGDRGVTAPYGRAMNNLLLTAGFTRLDRVRISDKKDMFWSQKPQMFRTEGGEVDPLKVKAWITDDL